MKPAQTAFQRAASLPSPAMETAPAPPARTGTRKYTVKLDLADADSFDQLVLDARRRSGRHIEKSDLVRGLIKLATHDADLLDRLLH